MLEAAYEYGFTLQSNPQLLTQPNISGIIFDVKPSSPMSTCILISHLKSSLSNFSDNL